VATKIETNSKLNSANARKAAAGGASATRRRKDSSTL